MSPQRPEGSGTTKLRWDGAVLHAAITGRATAAAIDALREELERALAAGETFAVLFDRRAMTAVTADGRAALQRWGAELTPRLGAGCLAWADLFDQRRAASLARAEEAKAPAKAAPAAATDTAPSTDTAPVTDTAPATDVATGVAGDREHEHPYPQRTFADPAASERWLREVLAAGNTP